MELRILTHGGWGMDMLRGVEMIIGKTAGVEEVALEAQMTLAEYTEAVVESIKNTEQKYLFLTDFLGGTTTNVALKIGQTRNIEVICGFNAALLLELCQMIQNKQEIKITDLVSVGKDAVRAPLLEMKERVKNE